MTTNIDIELDLKESNIFVKLEKFESICRICLSEDIHNSKYLNEMHSPGLSLAEMVMLCAQVDIQAEDRLPDAICEPCLRDLQGAHAFRRRCETSDSLLRRLLATREHLALTAATPSDNVITNQLLAQAEDIVKYEDSCSDGHDTNSSHTGITVKPDKIKREKSQKLFKSVQNSDVELQCNIDSVKLSEDILLLGVKGKVKCDICNKLLASKFSLKHHQNRMHGVKATRGVGEVTGGKGKLLKCNECPYSTPRKQHFLNHLRTHSGERPFACDICGAAFPQQSALNKHRMIHSSTANYHCQVCDKRFKTRPLLQEHGAVHTQASLPCTICNKLLKSKVSLQQHIKRHLDIKDYGCDSCGLMFVTAGELYNHKRTHGAVRRFECDICGKLLRKKLGLESHIQRHAGQRNFPCDTCHFSAYNKYELSLHIKTHTKQQDYTCPLCPVKFTRSSTVNKHMLAKHGIKYKINDYINRKRIH